jgi:glutathione S-transferase
MADFTLVVGNQNYSSWSLRPYLVLEHAGAAFDLVVVPLRHPDTRQRILQHAPSGRVPALRHGDLVVWDSLAICEYVAERFPEANLWPADSGARAVARSISAEMHSGFTALRNHMPMNIRADRRGRPVPDEVAADIARIREIWRDARARYGEGGRFLFGAFTIADAMYAPVVTRFRTYGVTLEGEEVAYAQAVWDLPALRKWAEAARMERWTIDAYE